MGTGPESITTQKSWWNNIFMGPGLVEILFYRMDVGENEVGGPRYQESRYHIGDKMG